MKVFFISLGCDKNLVDTEKMLYMLSCGSHEAVDDPSDADAAVINTCCFIGDAMEESINTILETSLLKNDGTIKYLVAVGCMAQRFGEKIIEQIPEVDAVIGSNRLDMLCDCLDRLAKGQRGIVETSFEKIPVMPEKRIAASPVHYTYLKIAEGCDRRCTYCVIPSVKGNYRSYDYDAVLREAQSLKDRGITELIVIAQETTRYGIDKYGKKRLAELLHALCGLDFIKWIRIMYCYPEEIDDELIEVMSTEKKICHYIDMPVQHASDRILRLMGRRTNRRQLEEVVGKLRAAMPDISIRTTMITGFPSETEEDVEELADFIRKMKFTNLGVFTYSREDGTPAYSFEGQVPAAQKKKRYSYLMREQKKIKIAANKEAVGKCFDVIVDGYVGETGMYVGRTYMDAPENDSSVYFTSPYDLMSGKIVKVKITDVRQYDLAGEMTTNDSEEDLL